MDKFFPHIMAHQKTSQIKMHEIRHQRDNWGMRAFEKSKCKKYQQIIIQPNGTVNTKCYLTFDQ